MKILIKIIIISLLVSCAKFDTSRVAPGYSEAFQAIRTAIFGYEDNLISKDIVLNIPYASALMNIGKGPKGLIILEERLADKNVWISADNVYIVTQNGRIVETRGLPNNLVEIKLPPFESSFLALEEDIDYFYFYSYDFPKLNNLRVRAKISIKGSEEVNLLMGKRELTLINEELENEYLGWSVVNKYWVDENFVIWKSIQNISPKLPPVMIEVTKKPST
tara:strand:+ start:5857 stop:6516 length:660 start_codon:yes stop_codon:yes gene_type:complete